LFSGETAGGDLEKNQTQTTADGLKAKKMRATKLQELEVMASKLLATARKLPPGPDRHEILQEIGRFRSQIIALQGAGLPSARRGLTTTK
jgi:hypothetical protein